MSAELVLISGITSFIGGHIAQKALQKGYFVRGTSRSEQHIQNVRKYFQQQGVSESQLKLVVVPDITKPGAFKEALKGVKTVIHVASPLTPNVVEYQRDLIEPALKGTQSILMSAMEYPDIRRVVITSSIMAITDFSKVSAGHLITENEMSNIQDNLTNFDTSYEAYNASKAYANNYTEDFVRSHNPNFTIATIHPSFVLGKTLFQQRGEPCEGTNRHLWQQFLGIKLPALYGSTVHVDSVADTHIKAMTVKIEPHLSPRRYLAASKAIEWKDALTYAQEQFPERDFSNFVARATVGMSADSTRAEQELGVEFLTFKQQTLDVVSQQLEMMS